MDPQERNWILRAQQGDLLAFEQLVIQHESFVMKVIASMVWSREDVEDVYQETFIRAFSHLKAFRFESAFRTWLIRIAVHQCLNKRRQRRWRNRFTLRLAEPDQAEMGYMPPSSDPTPEQLTLNAEVWQHLQRTLAKLPEKQRTAFILKYMDGCSLKEIAEILGSTVGTIKTDIFRAMQKVRQSMHQQFS